MRRINEGKSSRLATLLEIGLGRFVGWNENDWAEILRHQLASPLLSELKPDAGRIRFLGIDAGSLCGFQLKTFADLLKHPKPPLPLLRLAKDFAKSADGRSGGPLPPEVAQALYVALIAIAIVRHGERITTMNDATLCRNLNWAIGSEWMDGSIRQIATEALATLKP